jgi:septal ring factor EnvC (AmiA/AmiB activator)
MAFNWLVAFKVIPWGDVIAAAPTVAKTARDLWRTLKKPKSGDAAAAASGRTIDAAQMAAQPVEEQLRAMRAELAETRAQLVSTSEVLHTLAEQDEKLIAAVEALRVRTRVLLFACAALIAACGWLVFR